ncbi:MAG: hypothetical protein ACE5EJ_05740 [Nitrosopumilaceae archaeon]
MADKKISTSFRIDPETLNKLNSESEKAEVSLNSLVNQILKQHVEWHSKAADAGVGTIFKPMLKHLMSQLDEDSIQNLAKKIAKQEGKDFMMLLSHEYNINTALKLIEIWLKVIKYPYSYEVDGDKHKFFIHHDLGKKYSTYLSSLYENVLNEFNVRSKFKIDQNSISFTIDTKPNSPLLINDN